VSDATCCLEEFRIPMTAAEAPMMAMAANAAVA
jgi:hypothetical protein